MIPRLEVPEVNYKKSFLEWLWPPSYFYRIQRELNANERLGAFNMMVEWRERESKRLLKEFYETPWWHDETK